MRTGGTRGLPKETRGSSAAAGNGACRGTPTRRDPTTTTRSEVRELSIGRTGTAPGSQTSADSAGAADDLTQQRRGAVARSPARSREEESSTALPEEPEAHTSRAPGSTSGGRASRPRCCVSRRQTCTGRLLRGQKNCRVGLAGDARESPTMYPSARPSRTRAPGERAGRRCRRTWPGSRRGLAPAGARWRERSRPP